MRTRPLALLGAAALALLVATPVRAADDDAGGAGARREASREALEALRDATEAETDDDLEQAIGRFNDKVGGEQAVTRDQLMERLEPEDE